METMPSSHYLNYDRSIRSWLFTLDHKRIGIMYLLFVVISFSLGGFFALLMRIDLLSNTPVLIDLLGRIGIHISDPPEVFYNRLFTLHGAIMVFLFIIPSIPATLGNFVLPLMIGAKDVAFPRLNLASFYIYVLGAIFCVVSMFTGAADTGWTFYTPYSTTTSSSVISIAIGVFILGFSSILTGLNFLVTIQKMRAPGMTWFRMPLMLWAIYATSIIQILGTPVIAITLLLLFLERTIGVGIFDPSIGGDPVLFQHFFWFYSHPAVYIMILPAMGIMSELVTTFCKKKIFGYKFVAFSSIAIAAISFLVWGHHMFVSGQSELASTIFSFLTFLVAIPSAIKIFNWIATMYAGSIDLKVPYLWALSFIFLFCIGGFTGVVLGALSLDVHLHDTYFVVAHFHYVMVGGTVMAFFGGIHYWWPKIFGRLYNEWAGRLAWLLVFIGFNWTFFPQFILGAKGMLRRYYNYQDEFQTLHQYSSSGTWIITLGFAVMAVYLLYSIFWGKVSPANPWGGKTLEWQTSSPPPHENFAETPVVTQGPYEYEKRV